MKHTRRSVFKSGHQDANHDALVRFMSELGPEPIDTSKVGFGFPDLCWPFQGHTILVEVKTPDGSLSPPQLRFHREWRGGPLIVVASEEDVLIEVERMSKAREIRTGVRG